MFILLCVFCVATLSVGILLQIKPRTVLFAIGVGQLLGGMTYLLGENMLPFWTYFAVGLLGAVGYMMLWEKRTFFDGIVAACIGGSHFGLYVTFADSIKGMTGNSVVDLLFVLFYLLHIPAIFLSSDSMRLQKGWWLNTKGHQRGAVALISITAFALITAVILLPKGSALDAWIKILLATAMFWLSLSVIVLFVAFGQKRERSLAQDYYHSNMNNFMNMVRSQRHDYNLHVQTVAGLIAQQKWEECRGYVNALVQDTRQMNEVLPVKDPAVAGLIYYYRSLIECSGHRLFLDIRNDMSEIVTDAYETNKILGNLLQNALDEVSGRGGSEQIELSIFKRGECCLIRVSNTVAEPARFSAQGEDFFRQGYTTKKGHDGVGLSSIRVLARKAGGDVTAWLEGDSVHFVASVPMCLTLEGKGDKNENI